MRVFVWRPESSRELTYICSSYIYVGIADQSVRALADIHI